MGKKDGLKGKGGRGGCCNGLPPGGADLAEVDSLIELGRRRDGDLPVL